MRIVIGLANRRLQPLGHLSEPRNTYSFGTSRSNRPRDSGDSCDSAAVQRGRKSGHSGSPRQRLEGACRLLRARADDGQETPPPAAAAPAAVVAKVVTAKTALLIAFMALALAAFIATAWWVSTPCHPGERGFYIGHAMLMAGCPERRR